MVRTGFPEDQVQASKWYSLAITSGYKRLRDGKLIVEKKLPQEQLARAKRLVESWKPEQRETEVLRHLPIKVTN